jgi:hypothetical protein
MTGLVVGLIAVAGLARAAPPRVVPPGEARGHVGEVITVEGEVASAETVADTCVLGFGREGGGFRVVLLLPVFTDLPAHPERLYRGRRIRATGRVQQFRGMPEMVVRGAGQIEVVGFAAAAPPPDAAPPAAATPPPVASPGESRCARARRRWHDAGVTAREHAGTLTRCLDAGGYRCRRESEALAPALAALEWAEQQVEAACE